MFLSPVLKGVLTVGEIRKRHTPKRKFDVAIAALAGDKTVVDIAGKFKVHPTQVSQWKKQLIDSSLELFGAKRPQSEANETLVSQLYEEIGRLKFELDWLKKKLPNSTEIKRQMIEIDSNKLALSRQCELIGLPRSTLYYEPAHESTENLDFMRLIDRQYLRTPFYGSRNMTTWLRQEGYEVNRKRVQRLMRLMGMEAIYPKPRTSEAIKEHKKYPYLLRDLEIIRPNQVWSTDITYLPVKNGFMYLVAVIDWFSRYVLSWKLSNTMNSNFCIDALIEALRFGKPDIFNTDQGAQFTCNAFTGKLEANEILVSMDGRGRALDNIFIERLWRSLKYEEIYIWNHETVPALETGVNKYFKFYNTERPHQSLGNLTPKFIYKGLQ
ncbi:MAG: IS3 family transposase [Bdellovibrionales bacterium]|nr:IS3 family transposase [Bdellovibrionales bacterium]